MLQASSNPNRADDREKIAGVLADLLRQSYGDGVDVFVHGWTVTVSRGKPAAQIQVVDATHFLVGRRRNQTFRMRPEPVDRAKMASLVDGMVGERKAPETP